MKRRELEGYKSRLQDMQSRLRDNVDRLSETILSEDAPPGEHDGRISEPITKEVALEGNEELLERQVAAALQRIERGAFGICEKCESPISPARLEALPHAAYCVECEREFESVRK